MTVTRNVQLSAFPDVKPDRPVGPIATSVQRGTNGELMRTIAPLYLTGSVLDVTYGEGKWWTEFTPNPFTYHDKFKVDGVDFTALPEADSSIDTVCFDPPYVISGGTGTKSLDKFRGGFGLEQRGSDDLFAEIAGGVSECARVARSYVLVKCMEFVNSGRFNNWPFDLQRVACDHGLKVHDVVVHHGEPGPGGHNIFDVKRTRRAHSYLLVFEVTA